MRFSARMHHSLLRTPIKKPTCILYVHNSIEIFFTLSPTKTILSYSQKRISTPFRSIGPSFKKSWNKNNKILEIIRFKKIYIYIYIYICIFDDNDSRREIEQLQPTPSSLPRSTTLPHNSRWRVWQMYVYNLGIRISSAYPTIARNYSRQGRVIRGLRKENNTLYIVNSPFPT